METIPAALSGGGVTGVIIVVCWLVYKCCEKRSSRCHSLCVDISVSDGSSPNLNAQRGGMNQSAERSGPKQREGGATPETKPAVTV